MTEVTGERTSEAVKREWVAPTAKVWEVPGGTLLTPHTGGQGVDGFANCAS